MIKTGMSRTRRLVQICAVGLAVVGCGSGKSSKPRPSSGGHYDVQASALSGMCWGQPLIIDPPPPMMPTKSVAEACATTSFSPLTPASRVATHEAVVGRWVACPDSTASIRGERIEGIEFSENRRFQLFRGGNSSPVQPTDSMGRVVIFSSSPQQIGLEFEQPFAGTINMDARFSEDKGALAGWFNILGENIKLARIEPGPPGSNPGPPRVMPGACSPFGVWDTVQTRDGSTATFLFGDDGRFLGGARDSDVCAEPTMHGNYGVTPQMLTIIEAVGMRCDEDVSTWYATQFSPDCQELELHAQADNCTGARTVLSSDARLRRRGAPDGVADSDPRSLCERLCDKQGRVCAVFDAGASDHCGAYCKGAVPDNAASVCTNLDSIISRSKACLLKSCHDGFSECLSTIPNCAPIGGGSLGSGGASGSGGHGGGDGGS